MNDIAMAVREDLDFYVPRLLDVFLQIDAAVFECFFGFLTGRLQTRLQADVVASDTHAPASASRRRFDEHRKAEGMSQPQSIGIRFDEVFAARHYRNLRFLG